MSFFHTQQQIRDGTKDVTRRLGWAHLKPGQEFWAIVKGQGLKKGEHMQRLRLLECVSNRAEMLCGLRCNYTQRMAKREVIREGFPDLSVQQFIEMFCRHMNVNERQMVNRIEFKYLPTAIDEVAKVTEQDLCNFYT